MLSKLCTELSHSAFTLSAVMWLPLLFFVYGSLRKRGLVMLSVSGIGKTPLGMALLMALSRDVGDPDGPCFRLCS